MKLSGQTSELLDKEAPRTRTHQEPGASRCEKPCTPQFSTLNPKTQKPYKHHKPYKPYKSYKSYRSYKPYKPYKPHKPYKP